MSRLDAGGLNSGLPAFRGGLSFAIADSLREFNPVYLFSANEPGYIYDNNDLSSFFSDSAGTTAASVNGPVGLQLDKSRGLVLGSELWNPAIATATGESQVLGSNLYRLYSSAGAASDIRVDTILTIGRWYEVVFTIDSVASAGSIRVQDSGAIITASVGTNRSFLLATTASAFIKRNSAVDCQISNVSFKELPGNHRYQITAASRPTLRGTPTGGNRVVNGDFASGSANWNVSGAGVTIGGGKATITGNANNLNQLTNPPTIGKVYRFQLDVTARIASTVRVGFGSAFTNTSVAIGTTRITVYATCDYASGYYFRGNGASDDFDVDNIEIHDVSSGSVTAPYGLQYDGVDDFLQTASVNFTATDAMTLCMGVRKLSDAARGMFVELGNNTTNSIRLEAPNTAAAAQYTYVSLGATGASASYTDVSVAAPNTSVLTGLGDISSDTCILRVNGVQRGISLSDQGAGNYRNDPIYFGRRGGISIPLNGLDFGGVCIGRTLSAADLTSTERWVGQRTGVTI